jgi:peptidoglycan-associated lipoprotein
VKRILNAQGATPRQMETISYGEERPADDGHGESAWGQNRRVELNYQ